MTNRNARRPSRERLEAIAQQSRVLCKVIRQTWPTTGAVGRLPFSSPGGNVGPIHTELGKLAYSFNGRDLEQYERERRLTPFSSTVFWFVAPPTETELQALNEISSDLVLRSSSFGWPNPIGIHFDSLFDGFTTLVCYFKQGPVWSRDSWFRGGAWLRGIVEQKSWYHSGLAKLFAGEYCREPLYGLCKPRAALNAIESVKRGPSEIVKHGTFDQPKTEGGLPIEWLEGIEQRAAWLAKAIEGEREEAPQGQPAKVEPGATVAGAEAKPKKRGRPRPKSPYTDAELKLISVLTKHHQYADGGVLNLEPIGCRELAKAAEVSAGKASEFFRKKFDDYKAYKRACMDNTLLIACLKALNSEFTPGNLFKKTPKSNREIRDANESQKKIDEELDRKYAD